MGLNGATLPRDAPVPRPPATYLFDVSEGGRIVAVTREVTETAECVLYMAQVADAIGAALGAGRLTALEILGPASLYAAIETTTRGSRVRGALDTGGGATEALRDRLSATAGIPGITG